MIVTRQMPIAVTVMCPITPIRTAITKRQYQVLQKTQAGALYTPLGNAKWHCHCRKYPVHESKRELAYRSQFQLDYLSTLGQKAKKQLGIYIYLKEFKTQSLFAHHVYHRIIHNSQMTEYGKQFKCLLIHE